MSEIWKDIPGYEGLYQASSLGRIKSLPKQSGSVFRNKEAILSPTIHNGYYYVSISINGYAIKKAVHRLIAQTFIPNPENKCQVNHIDGNKKNNAEKNLEWATAKENCNHAIKIGLANPVGESNHKSKLKTEDILFIRSSVKSDRELSVIYSVLPSSIGNIRSKRSWKHI